MKKDFTCYEISLALSLLVSATVISFREYFLTNPFAANLDLVGSLQALSLFSLLVLILVPPLLLGTYSQFTQQSLNILVFSALAWPVSLMLVRVAIWRTSGLFVVGYWFTYPILFICEFGPSAIYLYFVFNHRAIVSNNNQRNNSQMASLEADN